MLRKRTILNLFLVVSLLAAFLAACGPTEEPTKAPDVAPTKAPEAQPTKAPEATPEPEVDAVSQIEFTEPVELQFWHTKTRSQEELLNEIVADFNASNEWGITVVPTSIEGSYDQIFKDTVAGLAVGEVPDLVVAYPSMVAEYMEAEAPLALDPYVASEKYGLTQAELDDYFPVYIEDNTYPAYDNQVLSWPFHKSMVALYANNTILEMAGVDKVPETWAEFYDACKAVVENTDATNCWSIHVEASDLDGFMASVGVYPQADSFALTSKMNDPAFVEWFEMVQQMVNEGLARPEAERYSGDDEMIALDAAFTTGSTSGIYYFPANEDGTFAIDWSVVPVPHAEGVDPVSTVYGANVMAVKEDDAQRDLAKWLFIRYWSSPDVVKKWILGTEEIRGSSYMPLQRSLAEDADVKAHIEASYYNQRWGEAVAQLEIGVIEPQLAGQQAVRDILEDAYLRIINGEDVQTVLDEGAALASEAFQLKGEPVAPPPTPEPAGDLLDDVMAAGKLVVSTDPNYAPQSFLDEDGNMDGFDIDTAKEVAERLGVEVEFVTPDWDMITAGNWAGRWDISIGSMTPDEFRAEVLWFSDPYYYVPSSFAVHRDNTDIQGAADMDGKSVGLGAATTYLKWLEGTLAIEVYGGVVAYDPPSPDVVEYTTDNEAVQDLALGDGVRLDAVISALPNLQNAIDEGVPLKLVGEPPFYEPLAFALDKSRGPSDQLLAKLNEILAEMHADGTLTDLSLEWFGVDYATPVAQEAPPTDVGEAMVIGTTDKVTVLDPADSYDFHTWEVHHNTMDTLLHYIPGTTDLEPGLATAMPEVSADGMEYTFKLVEGASFPDGAPFDAEAVKWSIDRVVRLEGDPNWLVTSFVDSVEVVDEYTVKFKLLAPTSLFPLLVATQPYSPISPECYSEDEFDADSTCGGVGPYVITKWDRDVEMVFEAYDGYPGPAPATEKIIMKYYADATTMRLAVESGEIDVATKTLNPTDYADLEAEGELQVIEGPGAQIRYICINVTTPPFDQAAVRQAIAYAADRAAITSIAFQGTHKPLYSMVPMGMWSHTDSFPERDLDMAKSLLEGAGFSADNKLVMDLWWTPTHYGPTEADVATVLKDNLEETGLIEVSLQNAEWVTYKEYYNAGSMPVFLLGWYPDYLDPDNYTWSFAHSSASDDVGIFYASDEMDALMEAGQTAAELRGADRLQLYEDIQSLWVEDVPTIPLTQGSLLVVAQPGVDGIVLDPNMLFHYFLLTK
jgi:peptide/nickel transport system substrate-binding protein